MRKKWIAALLSVAMVLSLLTGCGASGSKATSGSIAGTYEGTGNGRNGDIVVAVTLDDNAAITNIEVKEQQETEGVGDIAFDQMIPQMVEHNTIAVDAVATATITSNGLLEAVRNALTAAGRLLHTGIFIGRVDLPALCIAVVGDGELGQGGAQLRLRHCIGHRDLCRCGSIYVSGGQGKGGNAAHQDGGSAQAGGTALEQSGQFHKDLLSLHRNAFSLSRAYQILRPLTSKTA